MKFRESDPLAEAWGHWGDEYPFDVWCTLTFRHDEVSGNVAWERFTRLTRTLSREVYQSHIRTLVSCGPQKHRFQATPHFHAAFGFAEPDERQIASDVVLGLWPHGLAEAERYRRGGGALQYGAGHAYTEMLVSCPPGKCRQRNGCRVAGPAWPRTCPSPIRRLWTHPTR